MLIKILIVGLLTVVLSYITKQLKSEFSMIVNICGGLIIFFLILDGVTDLFTGLNFVGADVNISSEILSSIIKVMGVGYITEFCADIAEDSGNKFIASKVIFGGKIAICVMAFPIIKQLFQTIIALI